MEQGKVMKIAIVGPESTGKSSIADELALHFDTIVVPEYAREYCKDLDRNYTLEDEVNIFYGQLDLEDKLIPKAQNSLLICDTMTLTVKIWCDHLFGFTPQEVVDSIALQDYDLYLLMDIDLPWQEDDLRDFPDLREHFMEVWHRELQAVSANYLVISGLGKERTTNAVQAVERFLFEGND